MKYVTELQIFDVSPSAMGINNAKRMLCNVYHWRMVSIVKVEGYYNVYFEGEPKEEEADGT